MSQGQHCDLSNTKEELVKPSGLINGKNWLRHVGQSQRIDEMLLIGATKHEIAQDLIKSGLFKKDLATAKARVQRHIEHIRKEAHKIPLNMDDNGVWKFAVKVMDGKNRPIQNTNHRQIEQAIVPEVGFSEVVIHLCEQSDFDDVKI